MLLKLYRYHPFVTLIWNYSHVLMNQTCVIQCFGLLWSSEFPAVDFFFFASLQHSFIISSIISIISQTLIAYPVLKDLSSIKSSDMYLAYILSAPILLPQLSKVFAVSFHSFQPPLYKSLSIEYSLCFLKKQWCH